ncbi:OmpA family protein [Brumimicrobium mesophilum]|uniref:OmpA family protein n=1 Tax=Brumimicrobium mesophilum TaxID=392717 RepID=UPI000D140201|nr:OmpA family protein [Brumimicrobium mesophilum]
MDWSKKIGIIFIATLILASCSNKGSYGSLYFSGSEALSDTSSNKELTVDDYLSLSNVDDYLDEHDDRFKEEKLNDDNLDTLDTLDTLNSIGKKNEIGFPKSNLDTLYLIERISVDTTITQRIVVSEKPTLPRIKTTQEKEYLESLDSSSVKMVDTTKILTQEEQINLLNERNDSINRANIKENDLVETNSILISKKADTTRILTQNEQILQLKAQNDSLNKTNIVVTDTNKRRVKSKTPIIINTSESNLKATPLDANQIDTTEVVIEEDKQIGISLSDSLEMISDSISREDVKQNKASTSPIILDEAAVDSNANISESDTLFYAVFFDSTIVELNESNKESLTELVKEAKKSNYILHLSSRVDKSDTTETDLALINQRSIVVKNYLIAQGLDKQKIISLNSNKNFSSTNIELNQGIVHCRLILKD